jgi:hypothetical protein
VFAAEPYWQKKITEIPDIEAAEHKLIGLNALFLSNERADTDYTCLLH